MALARRSRISILFASIALVLSSPGKGVPQTPAPSAQEPQLTLPQIVEKLVEMNLQRAEALEQYRSRRLYRLDYTGFATGIAAVHARSARQSSAHDQPLSEEERARLLAKGKELFVERCARCHNERGDKPLKTGSPLNERGLPTEVIARAVSGRLRDKTEDERRGVTLYISSLMKTKVSENSPPKP